MRAGNSVETSVNKGFVAAVTVTAALGGLLFGYDIGAISGTLERIMTAFSVGPDQTLIKGAVVSAAPLGAVISSVITGIWSERLDRRRFIMVAAALYCLGAVGVALAPHVFVVMAARLLVGVGIGLSVTLVPMYLSETMPAQVRGMAITSFQMAINLGVLGGFLLNAALTDQAQWPLIFWLAAVPAAALFTAMPFLPGSPRYHMLKGREDRARQVLSRFAGPGNNTVEAELEDIRQAAKVPTGRVSELFSPKLRQLLVIGAGLFFLQQASGITSIFYYAPTVLGGAGFDGNTAVLGLGVVNVLAGIPAMLYTDKWGRRNLLIAGCIGLVACMGLLGAAVNGLLGPGELARWAALGAVFLYIIFFTPSMGGVVWVLASEIFPLRLRGPGMAMVNGVNWTTNLVVSTLFPTLVFALGLGNTFWLFGLVVLATLVFGWFLVPETRGVPLERIEANLDAGKRYRRLGD